MNNKEVAAVLDDIGDMLEILGDNPFRIRAHHRAANSIRSASEDVRDLAADHKLAGLPAVGAGLAERIEELINTGRMAFFEELKERIPAQVLDLMRVPGLGPRKAKQLYDELKITNVDELLAAAQAGHIRSLKGMSEKTEENIIAGVELLRGGQGRMLLNEAYPIAKHYVEKLRGLPFVDMADFAGSLRRMRETIGDIDILAASGDPASVASYFAEMDETERVLALGDTKASVLARNGLQVDLRVVKPDEYGAALQYFTGSKDHNITLRDIAKKQGLKVSEYGVFDNESGKKLAGKSEEEVYRALKMDYIEPEMRENHGEIAAAAAHKLPDVVTLQDVKGDLQSHSDWSDGLNNLRDMALEAKALGYEYLAITDHAEKLKIAGGMTPEQIKARKIEIDRINSELGDFIILNGIELNIDGEGGVDYDDKLLAEFDIVLAAIHSGFGQPREKIMARMAAAMENPRIHIMAHPTGRIIGKRNPYDIDIDMLLDTARDTGTVLEINAFPDRLDLKDDYLREAKKRGNLLSLGTDSHMAEQLKYMIFGVATARRGWLEAADIINTRPLADMLKLLK